MKQDYFKERLSLLGRLLERGVDITDSRFWTLDPKELRFKHGETLAELKIPYHIGAEDEKCIEEAVISLVGLIRERFRPPFKESQKESQPFPITVRISAPIKERTFNLNLFLPDSPEKELAGEIIAVTPLVDNAILYSWLISEGYGKRFIRCVTSILKKALDDEARNKSVERTSYLATLAIINTIKKKEEKLKDIRIKWLAYEKLDLAVGITIYMTLRYAIKDLSRRLVTTDDMSSMEVLLMTALVPFSFLLIPSNMFNTSLNPYGINAETIEAITPYVSDLDSAVLHDLEDLLSSSVTIIKKQKEVFNTVKLQYGITRFREYMLSYLMDFDLPGGELHELFHNLYQEDRLIRNYLKDHDMTDELVRQIDILKGRFSKDPRRTDILANFQTFLSGFNKTSLTGWFTGQRREAETFVSPVVERFFTFRFDERINRVVEQMRLCLIDRRKEYDQNLLVTEYNKGRLYRFSSDERPILKTLEMEKEGQLFVDMEGFTRKTLRVKEIAMAEIMRVYFYKPILEAASKYGMTVGAFGDERAIRLNNLPGDAAIFSGGVANLVSLAKDIQKIISRYREELEKKLMHIRDESLIDDVHRRFKKRREEIKRKREELKKVLSKQQKGIESRLMALVEEEERLENMYIDELEEAITNEMEAGLFISYGAKAETMVIESKDITSGSVRVAIGEKINEAARGTFRNPMVRAKLEMLLEKERRKRENKNLQYPFDVYIDRLYSIRIPPELDTAIEKFFIKREPNDARTLAQTLAREYLNDLKKIISGMPFSSLRLLRSSTDIYNKGQALSLDALKAYIDETKNTRFFFKKVVKVDDLDKNIRDKFFFPSDQLEFYFGVEEVKGIGMVDIFYRAGEVVFKGFETKPPVVVYEILNREKDLFKALLKHHFYTWLNEAKERERRGISVI